MRRPIHPPSKVPDPLPAPLPVLDRLSEWGTFHPGPERVRAVLAALGQPERAFRHVLVGGTNGKGTVSATLARAWAQERTRQGAGGGGQVGLFLSPHLMDVRERITVWGGAEDPSRGGQWIPDAEWRAAYDAIVTAAPAVNDPQEGLSYFEWLTVLAVVLFARRGVEAAVFEVGVGGRDDATNALDPEVSVVTSVALDHTALLGPTVEAIALHKVGIARRNRPLVLPASLLEMPPVVALIEKVGAIPVPFDTPAEAAADPFESNRRAARAALEPLGIGASDLSLQTLPGRREVLPLVGAGVVLDGAHNPQAWWALVEWLRTNPILRAGAGSGSGSGKTTRWTVLANLSQGRNPREFLEAMEPLAPCRVAAWVDPESRHERELPASAWPTGVERIPTPQLPSLLEAPLLVSGSLYTVGRFRRWLVAAGWDLP